MFEPLVTNLVIGNGQVATTATLIAMGPSRSARRLNIVLSNTGTQDETVILTTSVNAGTARRVWRGVLSANWQARICGLPLNLADTLLAVTTNASVVDYVISCASDDAPLTMAIYDDSGLPASAPQVIDQLSGLTG